MDDVTWGALTLTLTAVGGFYTWWAWKNRGATPAIRGLALTLLPAAAYLTGTLRMFTKIIDAVADWATSLVFSPSVWLGVVLAGVSVALFFLSGFLRGRGIGGATPRRSDPSTNASTNASTHAGKASKAPPRALPRAKQAPGPLDDDGIDDEIAAILKRRGIS